MLTPLLRDAYRILTYSPFALRREKRALRVALSAWNGRHLFCFPYMCVGGAEQIHIDILASVAEQQPLVLICGTHEDRSFEGRFRKNATIVEIPRLVNHPFTRKAAARTIADRLNKAAAPTFFSSLTNTFFDVLPWLQRHVRTFHLQHAFLYQPEANRPQKHWMPQFPRVDHFVFYSHQARDDWEKFLVANKVPYDRQNTFKFMPNAVHRFGEVKIHERTGLLFVGRQSPVKRIELFLQLTDELERQDPGRFRFSVAGYETIGDRPHVSFHGRVSDSVRLSELYSEHDAVVQVSTLEGYPMVIMEAMAHGLVIMSTPVGDVPNQVDTSFAMLSSAVDEATVLREMSAFVREIDGDRERMHRMKAAAFAKARSEYDPAAFRERYRVLLLGKAST